MPGNRDATASWAGYIYQSLIGFTVALEEIIKRDQTNLTDITLVFEMMEDFSLLDGGTVLQTHQVKNYKSVEVVDYNKALKELRDLSNQNTTINYFINISRNLTFNAINFRGEPQQDLTRFQYRYQNNQLYLTNDTCLGYMKSLIERIRTGIDSGTRDYILADLIYQINEAIIRTKAQRDAGNTTYQETFRLATILQSIQQANRVLSEEVTARILREKLNDSFFLFSQEQQEISENLDRFMDKVNGVDHEFIIKIFRNLNVHHSISLTSYEELLAKSGDIEGIQAVLYKLLSSVNQDIDYEHLIYKKDLHSYRPSNIRFNSQDTQHHRNMSTRYISSIIENLRKQEIRDYFQVKNIVHDGETVENIWEIDVIRSRRADFNITDADFSRLVSTEQATREINE